MIGDSDLRRYKGYALKEKTEVTNLKHMFNGMYASIHIHTSGARPGIFDLLRITVLPLAADLSQAKGVLPLKLLMKPKRPEFLDMHGFKGEPGGPHIKSHTYVKGPAYAKRLLKDETAMDPVVACTTFAKWFDRMTLTDHGRIIPICWDWAFIAPFLEDWFGYNDLGVSYISNYFHKLRHISIKPIVTYLQDVTAENGQDLDFNSTQFNTPGQLMHFLDIPSVSSTNDYCHNLDLRNIYQKLSQVHLFGELFPK